MNKGFKIHLYPTKEQEEYMYKHIDTCRFVWNYMVNLQHDNHVNGDKFLGKYDMTKHLRNLKHELSWLNDVSSTSLEIICMDVEKAYIKFFNKKSKYPQFKSKKRSKKSFPVRSKDSRFYFGKDFVKIEKLGKVRIKTKHDLSKYNKFYNGRISLQNRKWILSFTVDIENQNIESKHGVIGIDLGIKELAVCSYNYKEIIFHNINKSKKVLNIERKLKYIDKVIARKFRANKSYNKTNRILKYFKIRKNIYYRLTNIRKNYIHQCTHKLISLNPQLVVMETLHTQHLMKNKHLASQISKQYWWMFKECMKYKCNWNGVEFIQVDRFYPSSKVCSCCGNIKTKDELKLSDRVYRCKYCGNIIDRDYNAAINLMQYGMNIIQ